MLTVFIYPDVRYRHRLETQNICKFSITVVGLRAEIWTWDLLNAKRKCNYKTAGLWLKETLLLYLPNYNGWQLYGRCRGKTHGDDRLGVGSALPSAEERDVISNDLTALQEAGCRDMNCTYWWTVSRIRDTLCPLCSGHSVLKCKNKPARHAGGIGVRLLHFFPLQLKEIAWERVLKQISQNRNSRSAMLCFVYQLLRSAAIHSPSY